MIKLYVEKKCVRMCNFQCVNLPVFRCNTFLLFFVMLWNPKLCTSLTIETEILLIHRHFFLMIVENHTLAYRRTEKKNARGLSQRPRRRVPRPTSFNESRLTLIIWPLFHVKQAWLKSEEIQSWMKFCLIRLRFFLLPDLVDLCKMNNEKYEVWYFLKLFLIIC